MTGWTWTFRCKKLSTCGQAPVSPKKLLLFVHIIIAHQSPSASFHLLLLPLLSISFSDLNFAGVFSRFRSGDRRRFIPPIHVCESRLLYQCTNSSLRRIMPSQHLLPIHLATSPPPTSSSSSSSRFSSKKGDEGKLINGSIDELTGRVFSSNSRFGDEERKVVFEPLMGSGQRGFSSEARGGNGGSPERQRMQRNGGDDDVESGRRMEEEETVGEEVERVAEETWMVTRLGVRLLGYLGYESLRFLE